MKQLTVRALFLLPFLLVNMGATRALAATPHRSATARAAQALPSGQILLQKMRTAIQRSGTFHFTAAFTITIPGVSNTLVGIEGDDSTSNNAVHAFVTTSGAGQSGGTGLPTSRMEVIVFGARYAQRSGQQPWQCLASSSVQPLLHSVGGTGKITNPQTLGTRTVATVPTWRVRARSSISFRGFNLVGPINYYIARRDFTLIRVTARATIRSSFGDLQEHQATSYSRYGEPLRIQLPPACAR